MLKFDGRRMYLPGIRIVKGCNNKVHGLCNVGSEEKQILNVSYYSFVVQILNIYIDILNLNPPLTDEHA